MDLSVSSLQERQKKSKIILRLQNIGKSGEGRVDEVNIGMRKWLIRVGCCYKNRKYAS